MSHHLRDQAKKVKSRGEHERRNKRKTNTREAEENLQVVGTSWQSGGTGWKEWKGRGGIRTPGPHTTLHASATRLHCLIVNGPVVLMIELFPLFTFQLFLRLFDRKENGIFNFFSTYVCYVFFFSKRSIIFTGLEFYIKRNHLIYEY